jgi:hypothetical protein
MNRGSAAIFEFGLVLVVVAIAVIWEFISSVLRAVRDERDEWGDLK